MSDEGASRSLIFAFCLLTVSAASAPVVVRWAYGYWNGPVIIFALGLSLPVTACVVWTLVQERRRGTGSTSFAAGPLAVAALMIAASVIAICLLGFLGALIDFILIPSAVVLLALAWVQPGDADTVPTALLGLALTPLAAWFAGRADEYLREGVISAAFIVGIVAILGLLRRRRNFVDATTRR